FGRRGGQNILEPAACGKPVLFGPRMENFQDSVQVLVGRGGLQVKDPIALLRLMRDLRARLDELRKLGALAREAVSGVRGLAARGHKPAVLSRGYGRRSREPLEVGPEAIVEAAGDEPLLLARRGCKVFVGPRRSALAQLAIQRGADVLLLDDGLQHYGLARDLDIIVADASNPFGNGRLLPAGPLREPVAALRRVRHGL